MKIFNLSLNRSATTSLHEALEILGFKTLHDISPDNIRPWRANNKPLLKREIEAYDGLSVGLGWFGADVAKELARKYPEAYYIVIRRDLESWLDSWDRYKITTTAATIIAGSAHRPMIKTSNLINIWNQHKTLLDSLTIKNLLILDIDDLNWGALTQFLEKPIPDHPFPHASVSGERVRNLADTLDELRQVHIIQPPTPEPARPTRLFKHLLLTRYNLRLYNTTESPATTKLTPEGWMWHRYWLFREFCVPSILRQTNQDFEWLIFVDSKTPRRQLKHIKAILPNNARTVKVSHYAEIADKVVELKNDNYTLTTMLDNDDMLREDAIEQLQILARRIIRRRRPASHCIDIPSGYTITEDLTEFYECEVVTAKKSKRTSFVSHLNDGATRMHALRYAPLCDIPPERISFIRPRLWARIIHSANVCNQLTGSRCAIPAGFGIGVKIKLPAEFPGV